MVFGFDTQSSQIITNAFSLVAMHIKNYGDEKKDLLGDGTHFDVIESEIATVTAKVEKYGKTVKDTVDRKIFQMHKDDYSEMMNMIRSALEEYLKDTLHAKSITGISSFDSRIAEIRRLIGLDPLKDRKSDLFREYFRSSASIGEGKRVEIFLSYSHVDKILAGSLAKLLREEGVDVFLAHDDINISDEWREEILKHLDECSLLIALLTPNFEKSVWANQESGFAFGKGTKTIPLIVGDTNVKMFGLLESKQGIHLDEGNLQDCVKKIFKTIFR